MTDPVMQQILQQMTQDPKAAAEYVPARDYLFPSPFLSFPADFFLLVNIRHLRNPAIATKLQKLVDAGIVSFGN